jgi:hypothetical protein
MNRKEKIQALQKVFETGNKSHIEGVNNMVIHSVIVESDGWYQIVEIKPTFEIPDRELTLKEFEEWKGCIPLFPDIKPIIKNDR